MNAFLNRVAVTVTNAVGTVWCAVIFGCITLVSLPAVIASHDVVLLIQWVGSVFLQLVLLPLIMVGQNLASDRTEALLRETHDMVKDEFREVRAMYGVLVPRTPTEQ